MFGLTPAYECNHNPYALKIVSWAANMSKIYYLWPSKFDNLLTHIPL